MLMDEYFSAMKGVLEKVEQDVYKRQCMHCGKFNRVPGGRRCARKAKRKVENKQAPPCRAVNARHGGACF